MYVYKMIQFPREIHVGTKEKGNEAAACLQYIVDQEVSDGWEFYRVDSISIATSPGCLGTLFGKKDKMIQYNVVCFRKAK